MRIYKILPILGLLLLSNSNLFSGNVDIDQSLDWRYYDHGIDHTRANFTMYADMDVSLQNHRAPCTLDGNFTIFFTEQVKLDTDWNTSIAVVVEFNEGCTDFYGYITDFEIHWMELHFDNSTNNYTNLQGIYPIARQDMDIWDNRLYITGWYLSPQEITMIDIPQESRSETLLFAPYLITGMLIGIALFYKTKRT